MNDPDPKCLMARQPTLEELETAIKDFHFDSVGFLPMLELSCDCGATPARGRCNSQDAQLLTKLWLDKHPAPDHHAIWRYALPARVQTPIKEGIR